MRDCDQLVSTKKMFDAKSYRIYYREKAIKWRHENHSRCSTLLIDYRCMQLSQHEADR